MKQAYIFPRKSFLIKQLTALAMLTAVALTGCGLVQEPDPIEEAIALQEPIAESSNTNTEPAALRNLYDFTLYHTTVSPYIEEYSFDTNQQFGSYGPLLGDRVRKGDILMAASGSHLTSQIADLQETLQSMAKEYIEYCAETEESLLELRGELSQLQSILNNLDQAEPAPTVSENDGELSQDPQLTPEYLSWKEERRKWQGQYNLVDYYITTAEREMAKREELYHLDSSYYSDLLQELLAKRNEEVIRSRISGVVVALGNYLYGDALPKGQPTIAVADLSRKYLQCSYIRPRLLTGAVQIYAFIDGKRYDVAPAPGMDDELNTHTTFQLLDADNEVSVGSYAVLVLVSGYREQALTIPTEAIHTENSRDFVYVLENGQSIQREIKKGISDSRYTEILSGLSEGASVLVEGSAIPESSTAVLQRGTVSNTRQLSGKIIYPLQTVVENPVENGTVYLKEYAVKQNAFVTAGEPLAFIDVEPDLVALSRREVNLQRQKERLEDLVALNREEDEKSILLAQESIQKEEEALAKIKADHAASEILSPASGYVVYLKSRSPGELISPSDPIIARIANQTTAYLSVEPSNGISAGYGAVLTMECTDSEGEEFTVTRPVLTMDNYLLSDSLAGNALIFLPLEVRQKMVVKTTKPITVQFETEKMENVILVPVDAVTVIDSDTYVNVKNEDGSVTTVSFLGGGHNKEYYWAIDGLSEGMVICWE